jgi:hypothetical protein
MNYPFHINPETNRANKCYNVDRCRFGLAADDHYATATEALAVRDERIALGDIEKAREVFAQKHDARLFELMKQHNELDRVAVKHVRRLATKLGVKGRAKLNPEDIVSKAEKSDDNKSIQRNLESAKAALTESSDLKARIDELDKDYTGWNRYFFAPGGNVHATPECDTLSRSWENPIDLVWLSDLSDKPEEAVVKNKGAILCTTCFVDAPAEWSNHYARAEEKARTQCEGSVTTDFKKVKAEEGADGGEYGICKHCNKQVSITKAGTLRSHRPAEAKAEKKTKAEVKDEAQVESTESVYV